MCTRPEGRRPRVRRTTWIAVAASALSSVASSQNIDQSPAATARAFTTQYCVACHNDKAKVAGVSFEKVDWETPGTSGNILEKAVRKVSTGEMPPAGMPHPTAAAATGFTSWLVES